MYEKIEIDYALAQHNTYSQYIVIILRFVMNLQFLSTQLCKNLYKIENAFENTVSHIKTII